MRGIHIGDRFGRLTVISDSLTIKDKVYGRKCRCDCGKETIARTSNLRNGNTRSCGCFALESISKAHASMRRIEHTYLNLVEKDTPYKNNKTGVRGVCMVGGLYRAYICFNGKQRSLGKYKTLEQAKSARKAAEEENKAELERLQNLYKITKGK